MKISLRPRCPKSIRSTINQVERELLKIISDAGAHIDNTSFSDLMTPAFKRKWCFRKHPKGQAIGDGAYISKRYGVVVKMPYVCSEVPKFAIYTRFVEVGDFRAIYIQPLADRNPTLVTKAYNIINAYLTKQNGDTWTVTREPMGNYGDQHRNNVGAFMGQAVSFDW